MLHNVVVLQYNGVHLLHYLLMNRCHMPARYKLRDLLGFDLTPQEMNFVIEFSKDFNAQRAAVASGYAPGTGYSIKEKPQINAAIEMILQNRLETSHIDAEWVLMEAVDNHMLARQADNITASNTALTLIAKHTMVDAMASDKLNMNVQGDQAVIERLLRGRRRAHPDDEIEEPTQPDPDDTDELDFF